MLQTIDSNTHIEVLHLRLSGSEYHFYDIMQALLHELGYPNRNNLFADTLGLSSTDLDWNEAGTGLFEVQANTMAIPHFVRLADWAFGPHGIETLKILAYGDFSCEDRHKKQQAILVRADLDTAPVSIYASSTGRPYRLVLQQNEFFDKYLGVHDTISACSLENFMDNSDGIRSL